MKSKIWLAGWSILVVVILGIMGAWVYKVDPYFHFHKPHTDEYFYSLDLNNQRSQNDGISKHFDYNALITGTSMTENFKTSELDELFGVNSIKVPFSGGSYKEINDNLVRALAHNDHLKTIVRGLDMNMFFDVASRMRLDLGVYPTYLYDNNPFNDVEYLFNRDVIFNRVYTMASASNNDDFKPGITSFDDYRWPYSCVFGRNTVCPNKILYNGLGPEAHISDEEKDIIFENITQNVTSLANAHPDVEFYYFFTPYSIAWWKDLAVSGTIYKQIEAEQYIIELILAYDNIHLFSFNNRTDVTTDLNHYKDVAHYGQWVNSMVLRWMHDGKYLLTNDNYKDYLAKELDFYTSYDYNQINNQQDYESDFYAAALLNEELTGKPPLKLFETDEKPQLLNASIMEDPKDRSVELHCRGSLNRDSGSEQPVPAYLLNNSYVGAKFVIENMEGYHYLVFYGKKVSDHGQPSVYVYNEQNEVVGTFSASYHDLDNEWHQYVIDLTKADGKKTIIFNGGYIDNTGSTDSTYLFKDITLY